MQDNAIRHLTDKQTWYDLEGHSLMSSRAASMAGDREVLSDGYLSDSAMEEGKDKNKKKKPWKVANRTNMSWKKWLHYYIQKLHEN